MTDFFDSIRDTIKNRIFSPLSGGFLISWLIINYKIPLILASSKSPQSKVDLIGELALPCGLFHDLWLLFIAPLASTLAYIYIYPYAHKEVLRFTLERKIEIINMQKELSGFEIVTREEVEKIESEKNEAKKDLYDAEIEYEQRSERYKNRISELEKENRSLKEEIEKSNDVPTTYPGANKDKESSTDSTDLALDFSSRIGISTYLVIKVIHETGSFENADISTYASMLKDRKVELGTIKKAISDLESKGLIKEIAGLASYTATNEGLEFFENMTEKFADKDIDILIGKMIDDIHH